MTALKDAMQSDRRYYEPKLQTMPLEGLYVLQAQRLARQLDRIWSTPILFFKRKLEAAGLKRADLQGLDALRSIPTTLKAELRKSEEDAPPFGDYRGAPVSAAVRLGASTGTSGRPTLILWTRKDLEVDYAASFRGRWRWGLRPGMSLANAHPFGMNAGGWHFSHGIEGLGVLNIPSGPPVGAQHIDDVLEVWRRLKPDMYRLFGNVATTYSDAARKLGIDPISELNLTTAGDHPSEQYLMASSGLEALPLLGSACDERDGAHLAEDLAIVEVMDRRTGVPCGHGERGNLVVTVLEKDNFLLRYDLEDVVRLNTKACPCGETHRRLFYEGRVRDIVSVDGHEVLPIDVALILYEFPEVSTPSAEYQIVRSKTETAALRVRLEYDPARLNDTAGAARRLGDRFREKLGVTLAIDWVERGTVPRFAYKAARVIDA
ncbi:MAG: phenylacetate--CoA ligase family protein [Deltaproteobacteria bacterium]|nr:phenylacetate--CoA ligase family protein [Deltaproteobacteria bacterium]